jgi:hypothetical protein
MNSSKWRDSTPPLKMRFSHKIGETANVREEIMRHVAIRYFWMKDRVDAGEVSLEYKGTKEMVADVNTNPLQGALFNKFCDAQLGTTNK